MNKKNIFLCFVFSFCLLNSSDISYSPDEKYAAVISNDGKIKICEAKLEIKTANETELKQPEMKIVLNQLAELAQSDDNPACAVCWSSDGKVIASGSGGGVVDLWSVEKIEKINIFKSLKISDCLDAVSGISWSVDNKLLAIILKDRMVKVWGDFEQNLGEEIFSFDLFDVFKQGVFQVDTLDWSPCGKFIAVSGGSINNKIDSIILDVSKIYEKMDSKITLTYSPETKASTGLS